MTQTIGRTLALEDAAYQRAQREIDAVHDDLVEQRRVLTRLMAALLDGGWHGVAAEEFADGWSDWAAGCGEVLDGLAGMHDAMLSAYWTLHASDDEQGASMTRIGQRLGSLSGASGASGAPGVPGVVTA